MHFLHQLLHLNRCLVFCIILKNLLLLSALLIWGSVWSYTLRMNFLFLFPLLSLLFLLNNSDFIYYPNVLDDVPPANIFNLKLSELDSTPSLNGVLYLWWRSPLYKPYWRKLFINTSFIIACFIVSLLFYMWITFFFRMKCWWLW